ncbi:uncharacterized protein ARMOST_18207 [Armillaria ostoyae]|uniref:F-box domain-containing protein n=1 Tax=Armillaria ostoyae TaxID=47428 RepID=A0A284S164_ARMOS|nr:uncharacterized protein ARMOST_18207 [Armillaria ostoyae]
MNALHPNYAALRDVVNFVEYRFHEESKRTSRYTTISLPSFSTPTHIPVILRDPHYSVYKYISLPSLEFEDLNELEVLLRDSTISSPPRDGKFLEITLSNPMFRSILSRPVDIRAPDFRTLVLHNVATVDLQLWSDILKPFVRLAFSDVNQIILFGPGRISVPTCWARNVTSLKFSNVSMSRDTLYQIICSCLKLDILTLGHIHLTVTEAPAGTAALAANHIHDLKELSFFNFPNAHMADFLKLIRKSSRVKISVRSLRKLIVVMDPTLNSVLSADLKYELTALLRDNSESYEYRFLRSLYQPGIRFLIVQHGICRRILPGFAVGTFWQASSIFWDYFPFLITGFFSSVFLDASMNHHHR